MDINFCNLIDQQHRDLSNDVNLAATLDFGHVSRLEPRAGSVGHSDVKRKA